MDIELERLVSCLHCKNCIEIVYGKSAKCRTIMMEWTTATTLWYPEDFGCFELRTK